MAQFISSLSEEVVEAVDLEEEADSIISQLSIWQGVMFSMSPLELVEKKSWEQKARRPAGPDWATVSTQ